MKKFFALALALVMSLSLAACGSDNAPAAPADSGSAEPVVLKVAATPEPHAQILEFVKPALAEQGIDLQIDVYNDYVIPNTAVEEGDEDVNFFQHLPYLENFNAENGTHLVSVAGIHVEPMGVYPGKTDSLDALADGATVAVPNDATNEGRALMLLAAQGLITLADPSNLLATPNDIVENPKNLQFTELEAAMLPNVLTEVDIAVINSNYALPAGLNPVEDSLAIEDSHSAYVNILCVKEGNENNEAVQSLIAALQTDETRAFIEEQYTGAVVPAF